MRVELARDRRGRGRSGGSSTVARYGQQVAHGKILNIQRYGIPIRTLEGGNGVNLHFNPPLSYPKGLLASLSVDLRGKKSIKVVK